jgi:hypothetical protein
VEIWRAWWRSPQATQWHAPTAVYPLTRLLVMYAQTMAGDLPVPAAQAEMRHLETQFGLSPKGMRELKWVIGEAPEPEAKPPAKKSTPSRPAKVSDMEEERRRRALAAASGD